MANMYEPLSDTDEHTDWWNEQAPRSRGTPDLLDLLDLPDLPDRPDSGHASVEIPADSSRHRQSRTRRSKRGSKRRRNSSLDVERDVSPPDMDMLEQLPSSPPAPREPSSEPSEAAKAQIAAAAEEWFKSFPMGWFYVPTSPWGLLCGWYAVIISMQGQHPTLPCPTVQELQELFGEQTKEFAEVFDMSNTYDFSVDQVSAILYRWGLQHGLNLRIGYLEHGGVPLLVSHPNEDPDQLIVWIHNDGNWNGGGLGHFSGVRPIAEGPMTKEDYCEWCERHGYYTEIDTIVDMEDGVAEIRTPKSETEENEGAEVPEFKPSDLSEETLNGDGDEEDLDAPSGMGWKALEELHREYHEEILAEENMRSRSL